MDATYSSLNKRVATPPSGERYMPEESETLFLSKEGQHEAIAPSSPSSRSHEAIAIRNIGSSSTSFTTSVEVPNATFYCLLCDEVRLVDRGLEYLRSGSGGTGTSGLSAVIMWYFGGCGTSGEGLGREGSRSGDEHGHGGEGCGASSLPFEIGRRDGQVKTSQQWLGYFLFTFKNRYFFISGMDR